MTRPSRSMAILFATAAVLAAVPVAATIRTPRDPPRERAARPVLHAGKAYVLADGGDLSVADVGADGRLGVFRTVASLPGGGAAAERAVRFRADGLVEIARDAATSYVWDPVSGQLWCRSRIIEPAEPSTRPPGVTRAVLAFRNEPLVN